MLSLCVILVCVSLLSCVSRNVCFVVSGRLLSRWLILSSVLMMMVCFFGDGVIVFGCCVSMLRYVCLICLCC